MSSQNQTLLIVEDNDNDVFLIQRAFQKANAPLAIQVERDGDAALAYLSGTGKYADRERYPLPAVVLLDLKLPRKSGLEVLANIRQQSGLKRLPVVMLTSSRQAADINRAYDLGANSYLVKPVEFDCLLEMLKYLRVYWLVLNERPEVRGQ
jgi:CheY-like chemotaxis protein